MYEAVIGLEVHAELNTNTKIFCSCPVKYNEKPNSCVCPVCIGLPGALPVLNKKVLEYAIMLGLATGCKINTLSQHARKNYFYPDLPKGYQISQDKRPVCYDGYICIGDKKIRLNRIHIEEDAGKLVHCEGETRIDYNRAGVPLVEIVTEPDMRSAEEAKAFMERIKSILLSLGISECRMEKGHLRCDVNVSVRKKGDTELGERCEMKNINSFSAAVRSIEHEIQRQTEILKSGGFIKRETRKWDDEERKSVLLREKESESDYRYFPEPDLPMIVIKDELITKLLGEMPELAHEKAQRYKRDYSLSDYDANAVASCKKYAELFEDAIKCGAAAKSAVNMILGDISRIVNEKGITPDDLTLDGKRLAQLDEMIEKNELSHTAASRVVELLAESEKSVFDIVKENNFTQLNDAQILEKLVDEVLEENQKSVSDYKRGKTNALGYLTGQCMKKSKGRANPVTVNELFKKLLEAKE